MLDSYFLDLESVQPGEAVARDGDGWLCFSDPSRVLTTRRLDQVLPILELASNHAELGGWAAGFVSFDAGPACDEAVRAQRGHQPLAWFALFDRPPARFRELRPRQAYSHIDPAEPELSPGQYRARFAKVHEALARGDTYQVNLTFRQNFRLTGSPADLFAARCGNDPPPYAAFIHGGEWRVASFSPELFFERNGAGIRSQPMKGTRPRPADPLDENLARKALARDPKSRAENIMIVDMVRNDLGAVAEPGSISIDELLQVRRHRGLLQMTSTVSADTSATVPQLFKSLFPPASVTGAPKIATCRLIAELEASPRGVYCGAIGFMAPGRQRFNVAIRTAWIDGKSGEGEFGIGSGIVWDSEADSEYAECLAKRDFLLSEGEPWALTQSIPLHALGDLSLVGGHLDRLENSAKAFKIPFDRQAAGVAIDAIPASDPDARMGFGCCFSPTAGSPRSRARPHYRPGRSRQQSPPSRSTRPTRTCTTRRPHAASTTDTSKPTPKPTRSSSTTSTARSPSSVGATLSSRSTASLSPPIPKLVACPGLASPGSSRRARSRPADRYSTTWPAPPPRTSSTPYSEWFR